MKPTEQTIRQYFHDHSDCYADAEGNTFPIPAMTIDKVVETAQWAISLQPEWVSVKERLPEKTEYVIRYGRYTRDCPQRSAQALFVRKGNNPKYWYFDIGGIKSKDVTHWMPLPEAPQPPTT